MAGENNNKVDKNPNEQDGDRRMSSETADNFLGRDNALGASMEEDEVDFGEGDEDQGAAGDDTSGEEEPEGDEEEEEAPTTTLSEEDQRKIALVNAYNSNPSEGLKQLAQSQGYKLVRIGEEAEEKSAPAKIEDVDLGEFEWLKEPLLKLVQAAQGDVVRKSDLTKIQERLIQNEEKSVAEQLTGLWPEWKTKESEIRSLVDQHPTLVNDLPKLIALVKPTRVSNKTKDILKKGSTPVKASAKGLKAKGTSFKFDPLKGTFEEAFMKGAEIAAAELESRGEL